MKTKIVFLFLLLANSGAFAQHDHSKPSDKKKIEQTVVLFKDAKLGSAYEQYLTLKNALVASAFEEAKQAASELENKLTGLTGSVAATESASKLAKESTLKGQRIIFSKLSNEMAILVKAGQLSSGSLYLDYCPMANNNEGAFWLSNEKEIKNPYFGDKMLRCGMIKETIQ